MHILQSEPWQKFEESLGKSTFQDKGDDWSYLATLETTPLGPYIMVSRGPTLNSPQSLKPALNSLETLGKSQKALFIRLEPELESPALKNLKKSKSIHHEHTWLLDLTPSKDTLLAGMKQNNRNLWKNHQKKDLKITTSTDPKDARHLYSLLQQVSKRQKIQIYPLSYYQKLLATGFATLYLVRHKNKIIAAALSYDSTDTRYYGYAAADSRYRNLSAGTVLLAQMILDAKEKGQKTFDFWGIAPTDDPSHPWHGFTKFKKSFGGYPHSYAGTYDLILNKPKYTLYSLLRPINLFLRRHLKTH